VDDAVLPGHPDFETHPVVRHLTTARTEGPWVHVAWDDGSADRFYGPFLHENWFDPSVTSPDTRQRQLEPRQVRMDDPVGADVDGAGALVVSWAGGPTTRHHPGWLHHVVTGGHRPDVGRPRPVCWSTSGLAGLPTFDGPAVLADDEALAEWAAAVAVHGLGRLEGLHAGPDTVLAVAERLGVVRATHFGRRFDVVIAPENESNAYTALPLTPHVDIATRASMPGLQLLHCLVNDNPGGVSTMVDGFSVVEAIRVADPGVYEALTTLVWVHTNRSTVTDLRASSPVVVLDDDGRPAEIRLSNGTRALPDMADDDLPRAYTALRHMVDAVAATDYRIETHWRAGDLVAFMNGRILHGRAGFDPDAGGRHLQGCYVDADDLWSCLRIAARRERAGSDAGGGGPA